MDDVLTIIQGTNEPIRIDFEQEDDISDSLDFHVAIYTRNKDQIAHWTIDEMVMDGQSVYCPLTQDETISMPTGAGYLEMKRTDGNGRLIPYDRIPVTVEERTDKHILIETAVVTE